MSKYLFTILLFSNIIAQEINWLTSFEGSGHSFLRAAALDQDDNTIVAGQFGGSIEINGTNYTASGSQDMFVAKINQSGAVVDFVHFSGSTGDERTRGIDTDNAGNIYVLGRFTENINIDGNNINNVGGGLEAFVAKFSSNLQYQWTHTFQGSSNPNISGGNFYPNSLVANKEEGGCYVSGRWNGYITFGNTSHCPNDYNTSDCAGSDGVVAFVNSSGTFHSVAYVKHGAEIGDLNIGKLAYGGNGKVYWHGYLTYTNDYYGPLYFGNNNNFWDLGYSEHFSVSGNNGAGNWLVAWDWSQSQPQVEWVAGFDSEDVSGGWSQWPYWGTINHSQDHLLLTARQGSSVPIDFFIWGTDESDPPIDQITYDVGGWDEDNYVVIMDIDVTNNSNPSIVGYGSEVAIEASDAPNGYSLYTGLPTVIGAQKTDDGYNVFGRFYGIMLVNNIYQEAAGYDGDWIAYGNSYTTSPNDVFLLTMDNSFQFQEFNNITNSAEVSEWISQTGFSETGDGGYFLTGYFEGGGTIGGESIGSGVWNEDTILDGLVIRYGESGPVNTLTVLSPNGGENIVVGESYSILWETTGEISNVKIEFSTNGGSSWTSIIDNTSNDGLYSWTIPNSPSTASRVKISDTADNSIYDISDGNFTIYAPSLDLNSLQTSYDVNETVNVTWETTGTIPNVDISLSDNGGQSWAIIADEINNNNNYSWVVNPELVDNNNVQLKIASSADENINDISNSISVDPTDEPHVISVEDTPNDNGYFIDIQFTRSKYDGTQNGAEIYTVYRALEDGQWQATNSLDADGSSVNLALGTTFEVGSQTNFKITATMNEGTFESVAFNGTSMDNIAPATPSSRVFVVNGDQISLSWEPNQESDLAYYSIFGGVDQSNLDLITYTIETSIQLDFNTSWIYGIMATDHHGNESEMGIFSETVNVDDLAMFPVEYKLFQNYPNPFNPTTTIRYDLQDNGLVNIAIFDMKGSAVKTLINDQQTAGYKSIQWNATDNLGQPVSAGLYLYTIQAGEFRQTKKMVLLK
jgi:hypothetical protein